MKTVLFFTFLSSLTKSALWITIGILLKSNFVTLLTFTLRKPVPDGLIEKDKLESLFKVIKWVGIFIIAYGVCLAIVSFSSYILESQGIKFRV